MKNFAFHMAICHMFYFLKLTLLLMLRMHFLTHKLATEQRLVFPICPLIHNGIVFRNLMTNSDIDTVKVRSSERPHDVSPLHRSETLASQSQWDDKWRKM